MVIVVAVMPGADAVFAVLPAVLVPQAVITSAASAGTAAALTSRSTVFEATIYSSNFCGKSPQRRLPERFADSTLGEMPNQGSS
jgi:hypothetical protein